MAKKLPNLRKETDTQVKESQSVKNKRNPKRSTPRCIIIKLSAFKGKERILKTSREKQIVMYREPT